MNEIITITQTQINSTKTNSANSRDIYEYLELAEGKHNRWIESCIEKYDFIEGIDYISADINVRGKITPNLIVSMDMAKELCMVSNTPKGKDTRRYFIAVEKEANKPMSQIDMMIAQLQMTKDLENKVNIIESKFDKIIDDVVEIVEKHNPSEIKPSVSFLPVKALMSRYGMSNQTVMKVVSAFDPRVEDCSKFVDGVGISEYQAYNRKDMDRAVKTIMETAKVVSKLYYTSIYINGRFQCSLV